MLALRSRLQGWVPLAAVAFDAGALILAGLFLINPPAIHSSAADTGRLALNRAAYQAIVDSNEFSGATTVRIGSDAVNLWKFAFWAKHDERNFDLQILPDARDKSAFLPAVTQAQFVVIDDDRRDGLSALKANAAFDLTAQFGNGQGRSVFVFKRRALFGGVRLDQGFLPYEGPYNVSEIPTGTLGGRWALGPVHHVTVIRKSPLEDRLHIQLRALRDIKSMTVRAGGQTIAYHVLPETLGFVEFDVPLDEAGDALLIPLEIDYEGDGHTIGSSDRVIFYAAMRVEQTADGL